MALSPKGQATRLRVFAAVKAHMEATGECPRAEEIARRLGLHHSGVARHMAALNGATGLPLAVTLKRGAPHEHHFYAGNMAAAYDGRANPNALIPVDILMQIPQR